MHRIIPDSHYNSITQNNVRPLTRQNPSPKSYYDLVVIGAGTAGLVTAAAASTLGASVALIERNFMGGDCLNYGCVPSKALISSARVSKTIKNAQEFGVHASITHIDFASVMDRMRQKRAEISVNDSVDRFTKLGVEVFFGEARFEDSHTVRVTDSKLKFRKAVIATGTRAYIPEVPGLKEAGYETNETIFNLTKKPESIFIIGAGPIGCELSQVFNQLGSTVYLLHNKIHILDREDRDAAEIIQRTFLNEGINIILNGIIKKVEKNDAKKIVHYEVDGKKYSQELDMILLASGRVPNVEGLNLEAARVDYDLKSGVKVNDNLQTTNKKIYAAGDICSTYKFTHIADFLARIVVQNALFGRKKKVSDLIIPWCTYTTPEIAHVGMYAHEAETKGIAINTFKLELSEVDRAVLAGESNGFCKVHVQKGTDKILGATIVAHEAGNMISELTLALQYNIGLSKIANVIHPYPTTAEVIRKIGDAYNRTKLTPTTKKILKLLMKIFTCH